MALRDFKKASICFLIRRIGPPEYHLFQCIIRYGYKDARDSYDFENHLITKVAEFLQREGEEGESRARVIEKPLLPVVDAVVGLGNGPRQKIVGFHGIGVREDVKELVDAREAAGVAYMMGHTCVVASKSSSIIKKIAINVLLWILAPELPAFGIRARGPTYLID